MDDGDNNNDMGDDDDNNNVDNNNNNNMGNDITYKIDVPGPDSRVVILLPLLIIIT